MPRLLSEVESTHPIECSPHRLGEHGYDRPAVNDVRTFPGLGLVGTLTEAVAVGNLDLMNELLTDLPDDLDEQIAKRYAVTVVLVVQGQRLLGWLEVSDRIRETSKPP